MLIPCPIDKPYISLDNKIETQFLLLSLQGESKYWIKKVFDKTIAAQVTLWLKEGLAIRHIFSLVDMITNTKFSSRPNVFKIGVVWQ